MSDDITIPGLPGGQMPRRNDEGMLDSSLDVDLGDGSDGHTRRARVGLNGEWEAGSFEFNVNWDDASTYEDESSWDDAILLGED